MFKRVTAFSWSFLFLLFSFAWSKVTLDVKEKTLKNGLKILVVENHTAPVVSCMMRFKVGSVDERPGITGTAHLLEHMLFKGTKQIGTTNYEAEVPIMKKIDSLAVLLRAEQNKLQNVLWGGDSVKIKSLREEIAKLQDEQKKYVIKDELWETYLENGGTGLNASTGNDRTQYYVSLPANRLELWAWLESDRLRNPVLREFYSERDVVFEERRLRTDTQPFGKLFEQFNALAFAAHPYGWPVVGWPGDLKTVMREEVEIFFKQYYAPNNAIMAIVGDIKADEVFAMMTRYFEDIPPFPEPPRPVFTDEPTQEGERRGEVEFEANPLLAIGYMAREIAHPDNEVLDVAAAVLSQGRTSRLYKKIVEEKKLAVNISADNSPSRYPDLFYITATPLAPHTPAEIEAAVYEELERLKTEPVSQWELDKVKNQLDANFIRSLSSNTGIAFGLVEVTALVGDWRYLLQNIENMKKVTPDDIMRVAQKYFTKSNRTVVTLVKKEQAASAKL
ncbi:MAG TPA: pitrilysin family protein [candidate division Zixibacteria bacterium]|nr:pitrilysin family protein [candidate division Zixibacteria bacterium]